MAWEHLSIKSQGHCTVQHVLNQNTFSAAFRMETIETGKQRVHWGYQLVLALPDGVIVARRPGWSGSYQDVLQDCNAQLAARNLRLLVAGNASSYNESAMSGEGGSGYVQGRHSPLHIMSPLPPQDQEPAGSAPQTVRPTTGNVGSECDHCLPPAAASQRD